MPGVETSRGIVVEIVPINDRAPQGAEKMSRKSAARTRLRIEPLEKRLMLDGNVLVDVVDGDLVVVGDDLDNAIKFRGLPGGGYIVAGLPTSGSGGPVPTLINGKDEPLLVRGIDRDVRIYTNGGDDHVGLSWNAYTSYPRVVPDDLIIETGSGNDRITLSGAEGTEVGGDVLISTDSGDDFIYISRATVNGDLFVNTSSGDDEVKIRGSLEHDRFGAGMFWVEVGGNVVIETESGDDQIRVDRAEVGKDLILSTHSGNDRIQHILGDVRNLIINTHSGDDEVRLLGDVRADVIVNTHSGDDTVSLHGSVGGDAIINTHSGEDEVRVYRAATEATIGGNLIVNTGRHADSLWIAHYLVGDDAILDTGSGPDVIGIHGFIVAGSLKLRTADGSDTLSLSPWEHWSPILEFGVKAKDVTIVAGSGNDSIDLQESSIARNLTVNLGIGDDELNAVGNEVARAAYLIGGIGTDTVNDDVDVGNDFARLHIWGFEDPESEAVLSIGNNELSALASEVARATYRNGSTGTQSVSKKRENANDFALWVMNWFEA